VIALTLAEIASIVGGRIVPSDYSSDLVVDGAVHTDSRLVEPGALFFALPGAETDGHLFAPTAVAHISLTLRPGPNGPQIVAQVPEVDIGMLGLPAFFSTGLASQIDAALSLDRLFAIDPRLNALRSDIECVAVVRGGVAIGVHLPDVSPDAASCVS